MSRISRKFTFTLTLAIAFVLIAPPGWSSVSNLNNQVKNQAISQTSSKSGKVFNTGGVGLNFRSAPWGKVNTVLKDGAALEILATQGDWYKVKSGGKTGFVHSAYVNTGTVTASQKAAGSQYVDVSASTYLNVRSGPWGKILGKAHRGDKLEVLGKEGAWLKVKYGNKTAFVHSDYMKKSKPSGGSTANPGSTAGNSGTPAPGGKGWGGRPCPGPITSPFGYRIHPIYKTRKMHYGIDIGAGAGTPVKSLGPGKVIFAGWNDGYGNLIKVQHDNGYTSYYAHLKSYNVRTGQRVGQGSTLGGVNSTGSSTGNHLHFELRRGGTAVNPASVSGVSL